MKRRRCLWSAVAVVLAALALLVAFEVGVIPWHNGLEARARSVRLGMTESEVDTILGGPPAIKAPLDAPGSQLAVWSLWARAARRPRPGSVAWPSMAFVAH
jgi:hypothetical protein